MKHKVFVDGKYHSEVEQAPLLHATEEVCRCEEVGETCHVNVVYQMTHRLLHVAQGFVEYHYKTIGASPVTETMQ